VGEKKRASELNQQLRGRGGVKKRASFAGGGLSHAYQFLRKKKEVRHGTREGVQEKPTQGRKKEIRFSPGGQGSVGGSNSSG